MHLWDGPCKCVDGSAVLRVLGAQDKRDERAPVPTCTWAQSYHACDGCAGQSALRVSQTLICRHLGTQTCRQKRHSYVRYTLLVHQPGCGRQGGNYSLSECVESGLSSSSSFALTIHHVVMVPESQHQLIEGGCDLVDSKARLCWF